MKTLKYFKVYVLHSHVVAYVLNYVVKDILTQPDPDGRRGIWIVVLLEYDLEIKPTKLVKGQGLAKFMEQSNCDLLGINFLIEISAEEDDGGENLQVSQEFMYPLGIRISYMSYRTYKHLLI